MRSVIYQVAKKESILGSKLVMMEPLVHLLPKPIDHTDCQLSIVERSQPNRPCKRTFVVQMVS
ncbi:hypothetical protein HID58_074559 [Brassica napus]|uniref:Uncharacterized protein n=2 Tax=Brassica TaxID=3705 RepID=A0ABQ7YIV3_BRANA|nr:hypothetical protein HID58_074559 [Brassica napus]